MTDDVTKHKGAQLVNWQLSGSRVNKLQTESQTRLKEIVFNSGNTLQDFIFPDAIHTDLLVNGPNHALRSPYRQKTYKIELGKSRHGLNSALKCHLSPNKVRENKVL